QRKRAEALILRPPESGGRRKIRHYLPSLRHERFPATAHAPCRIFAAHSSQPKSACDRKIREYLPPRLEPPLLAALSVYSHTKGKLKGTHPWRGGFAAPNRF